MKTSYKRIYAEIDLTALKNNLLSMQKNLLPGTKIAAVVKADAYGHGAGFVSKELEPFVWGFAVATPEEGFQLRKEGITKPVLLLGHCPEEDFERVIASEIRIPLFEAERARAFSEAAKKSQKPGIFHVMADTGMGRLGLFPDENGIRAVKEIVSYPWLIPEGIFTHFATADGIDPSGAVRRNEVFLSFVSRLREEGIEFPLVHSANSAATIRMQGMGLPLCRAGITLYGLMPSDAYDWKKTGLSPVMSLYSSVIFVKTVPPGTPVGYGETFVTKRETVIATVSAGYADGYPRSLSNQGYVLLHGKRCPVIGRICMDQMMVDVTEAGTPVKEGDTAVLIGKSGEEEITMEELGMLSGRFNYEFACGISKRVPRLYVRDGEIVGEYDFFG